MTTFKRLLRVSVILILLFSGAVLANPQPTDSGLNQCSQVFYGLKTSSDRANHQRSLLTKPKFLESLRFLVSDREMSEGNSDFAEEVLDSFRYYRDLPSIFSRQIVSLVKGLKQVRDVINLGHGLVDQSHPWVTGRIPETTDYIWLSNIVYSTPSSRPEVYDEAMLKSVGKYLTTMVKKSTGPEEIPRGPRRRMPHAINYVHGSSHYNSAIFIFNDLQEGFDHFSNQEFRNELFRFVREQKREILLFFRDRQYSESDYAMFAVYLRTRVPWFLNTDGPKKNVMWGNKSPYPVVNLITEEWAKDLFALADGDTEGIVRPPIDSQGYFEQESYNTNCNIEIRWPERLLALYSRFRIYCRGEKGNHSLVDRTEVDPPGRELYRIHDFIESDSEK